MSSFLIGVLVVWLILFTIAIVKVIVAPNWYIDTWWKETGKDTKLGKAIKWIQDDGGKLENG